VGPQARKYLLRSSEEAAQQSSWLSDSDVARTWDGIFGGYHLGPLYLAAKHPLEGGGSGEAMLSLAPAYEL
jgi:hypothetical protein